MWTWDDRSLTELTDSITQIVDTTVAEGIALQPTIQVLYCEQDIHNPDYLEDPRLSNVLPANLIDWYHTSDGQWWRQRMLEIPIVAQIVEDGRRAELDGLATYHPVDGRFDLLFGEWRTIAVWERHTQ